MLRKIFNCRTAVFKLVSKIYCVLPFGVSTSSQHPEHIKKGILLPDLRKGL